MFEHLKLQVIFQIKVQLVKINDFVHTPRWNEKPAPIPLLLMSLQHSCVFCMSS